MPFDNAWLEWIMKPGLGAALGFLTKIAWDRCAGYFTQGDLKRQLSETAPLLCEVYDYAQIDGLSERLARIEEQHKKALALSRNRSARDSLLAALCLLRLSKAVTAEAMARRLDQTREIGEHLRIAGSGMSSGPS